MHYLFAAPVNFTIPSINPEDQRNLSSHWCTSCVFFFNFMYFILYFSTSTLIIRVDSSFDCFLPGITDKWFISFRFTGSKSWQPSIPHTCELIEGEKDPRFEFNALYFTFVTKYIDGRLHGCTGVCLSSVEIMTC